MLPHLQVTDRVRFGPFEVDLATAEVFRKGRKVRLSGQPAQVLVILMQRPGQLVTREELRALLWPDETFVDFDHGLNNSINKIREVLGDSAARPRYIETLPKRGYRFIVPIRSAGQTPESQERRVRDAYAVTSQPAGRSKEARPRSRLLRIVVAACACGVLLAGFGIFLLKPPPPRTEGFRFGPSGIDVTFPMWSPDGKAMVYVAKPKEDTRDQLFLRYLNSPVGIQLTHLPEDQTGYLIPLGWSNDRSHIVFAKQPNFFEPVFRIYSVAIVGGTAEFVMDHRRMQCCRAATLSPDGKALVSLWKEDSGTFRLYISDPLGTEPRPYLPDRFATESGDTWPAVRFSPDGKNLMFIIDGADGRQGVWLLHFPQDSKPPRRLSLPLAGLLRGPSFDWLPDSRHFVISQAAAADLPNHLWMADTASADLLPLTGGAESQIFVLVAPDGKSLIYLQYVPKFSIVSVSVLDGATKAVIDTGREESMPSWSGHTVKLAWVSNRNGPYEIWLREADGSERPVVTAADFPPGTNKGFLAPAISPDGERVIYQRVEASGVSRLWISSLSGGPPLRLTNVEPDSEASGSWSPDGTRFVYLQAKSGKNSLMLVKTSGNAAPEVLKDSGVYDAIPDWSPAGDWITFEDDKGSWNLISADGKTSKALGKIGNTTWPLTFSKDGKLLYGVHLGESSSGPNLWRGILFSLDPGTLRQKVIKDLGPSFVPYTNLQPGIRFSLAPDGQSFVYTIDQSRADWWILQSLPQPGWRDRLRSLFNMDSKPKAVTASGADRQ
jgi:eukaryotic-like serine/threonine-protein kinase